VVATEKKVSSPLVDETMVKKIAEIDKHVGMVYSGASRSLLQSQCRGVRGLPPARCSFPCRRSAVRCQLARRDPQQ
jgi:hypothetical protein